MMDCRGAGDSEHTADGYSIQQYAWDVVAVADALGLKTFTYVGHSMGGGVAALLTVLLHHERRRRAAAAAALAAPGTAADAFGADPAHRAASTATGSSLPRE